MFNKITIGQRITTGFSIGIIVCLLTVLSTLYYVTKVNQTNSRLVELRIPTA